MASTLAHLILNGHERYLSNFRALTVQSRQRFERADWAGAVLDARIRIDVYEEAVNATEAELRGEPDPPTDSVALWQGHRAEYAALVSKRDDQDLAHTFFNSVSRRFLSAQVRAVKFEVGDARTQTVEHDVESVCRTYRRRGDLTGLVRELFTGLREDAFFEDADRDAALVAERIEGFLETTLYSKRFDAIDMVKELFFRNKGAFAIGRIRVHRLAIPLAIMFRNRSDGAYVAIVMFEDTRAGRLFSNTRSNFHVAIESHRALVGFLSTLLPGKPAYELYAELGYYNHARTLLYDALFTHLHSTGERFRVADGTRGKVLYVFTLDGFPVVFKVIRDVPDPPKKVTRKDVLRGYGFVRTADRAGRMLDTLTFGDLRIPTEQFEDDVIAELLRTAPETVRIVDDQVEFDHVYVQRKVTPLPQYLKAERYIRRHRDAILDFGYLVRDLASVNIFVGDYLLKNFGVTSYGRVVSFDFDELDLLTNQRFRELPEARDDEEEFLGTHLTNLMVADTDCFPEQFETFFGVPGYLKPAFRSVHADLFDAAWYRTIQQRLRAAEVIDMPGVASYDTD